MTHETDNVAQQHLLQRGDFAALIGTAENEWLECKREPYQCSDERNTLELSKDVDAEKDGKKVITQIEVKN